jgi:beta-lactamase regulating signal transducer with metallopeptidase domain
MDTLLEIGLSNALMAAVLALGVAAVGYFWRRPAVIHCLWMLVLVKLITPPMVYVPVSQFKSWLPDRGGAALAPNGLLDPADSIARSETEDPVQVVPLPPEITPMVFNDQTELERSINAGADPESGAAPTPLASKAVTAPGPEPSALSIPWSVIAATVWLSGTILWCTLLAVRLIRFGRSLSTAQGVSSRVTKEMRLLAARIGLVGVPSIRIVPVQMPPLLWAVGARPQLFIPASLWQRLSDEQRLALMAHELAHLKRRDHWVRYLELLAMALYWWHPVVWWACREMREAEEQCCDAWVVWALPGGAKAYADALVTTVDFLSETHAALPVAASGIGQVHDLRRRLTMIMRGNTPRMLSSGGALAVFALAAVLLPWLPTWAQDASAIPSQATIAGTASTNANSGAADFAAQGALIAQRNQNSQDEAQDQGRRSEMDRAKMELAEAQRQLEHMHRQMEEANRRFEEAKQRFAEHKARLADRMAQLERRTAQADRSAPRGGGGRGGRMGGEGRGGSEGGAAPDQERRLADLERKLDAVMEELKRLRRDMRGRPGQPGQDAPPPGGPRGRRSSRPSEATPEPAEPPEESDGRAPEAVPGVPVGAAPVPTIAPAPPVPNALPRAAATPTPASRR